MSETPAPEPGPGLPLDYHDSKSSSVSEMMPQSLDTTFKLLLTLIHPSKCIRTSNRKTKNMKLESENKGPYDVTINIKWDMFLGFVADKLMVRSSSLAISTFEWHWLKPASSPWLPLQDENRLASILKKVKSKLKPYVIICMQAPVQKKVTASSAGNTWKVDALDSDLEENPVAKKVRIESFQ